MLNVDIVAKVDFNQFCYEVSEMLQGTNIVYVHKMLKHYCGMKLYKGGKFYTGDSRVDVSANRMVEAIFENFKIEYISLK